MITVTFTPLMLYLTLFVFLFLGALSALFMRLAYHMGRRDGHTAGVVLGWEQSMLENVKNLAPSAVWSMRGHPMMTPAFLPSYCSEKCPTVCEFKQGKTGGLVNPPPAHP